MVIGVDLGASLLHCASLDAQARLIEAPRFSADDVAGFAAWAEPATVVAIDAPAALSTAPHADDASLSPKFRSARCGEIALGREHGAWVSWVTPTGPPVPGWMEVGFAVHAAVGERAIEVYPHAGFRALAAGRRLAKKTTPEGRAERAALLRAAGVTGERIEDATHDGLDALLAALVALGHSRGVARGVTCGHDRSAIWLPAAPSGILGR